MTEAEWLACEDPVLMIRHLRSGEWWRQFLPRSLDTAAPAPGGCGFSQPLSVCPSYGQMGSRPPIRSLTTLASAITRWRLPLVGDGGPHHRESEGG